MLPKIYFTKQDKPYEKIRQSKKSGRAEDLTAQKYKANQKIKLEKRQGTQKDAYVKRTQYQNACALSTMLGIYPRGICKARRLLQRSEYPCGV